MLKLKRMTSPETMLVTCNVSQDGRANGVFKKNEEVEVTHIGHFNGETWCRVRDGREIPDVFLTEPLDLLEGDSVLITETGERGKFEKRVRGGKLRVTFGNEHEDFLEVDLERYSKSRQTQILKHIEEKKREAAIPQVQDRFVWQTIDDREVIRDKVTGRKIDVPLFAAQQVDRVLRALFGRSIVPITVDMSDDNLLSIAKMCGLDEIARFNRIWDGDLTAKQKQSIVSHLAKAGIVQASLEPECGAVAVMPK